MVFDVELPMADPSITISIWDKDILSPNDFISTGTLDYSDLSIKAFQNDCSIKVFIHSYILAYGKCIQNK